MLGVCVILALFVSTPWFILDWGGGGGGGGGRGEERGLDG